MQKRLTPADGKYAHIAIVRAISSVDSVAGQRLHDMDRHKRGGDDARVARPTLASLMLSTNLGTCMPSTGVSQSRAAENLAMPVDVERQRAPSVQRPLRGLRPEYQVLLMERYHRLLPILLRLMRPRDILERNRAWPGVRPIGQGATRFLGLRQARLSRKKIRTYANQHGEDADELWLLFRAYCRYGPIGLLEALPSTLPALIPNELQECADFHRLAKHPRSDAGLYIRELLEEYADELAYQRLPAFVARYAFASDRRRERWYVGEHVGTERVSKTTRRLNLDQSYEHQRWTL